MKSPAAYGSHFARLTGQATIILAALCAVTLSCKGPSPSPADANRPNPTASSAGARDTGGWQKVRHWLYQLQKLDVDRVAASQFELVVTDYSTDGSEEKRLTPAQVARLQSSPQGRRLVLAYL